MQRKLRWSLAKKENVRRLYLRLRDWYIKASQYALYPKSWVMPRQTTFRPSLHTAATSTVIQPGWTTSFSLSTQKNKKNPIQPMDRKEIHLHYNTSLSLLAGYIRRKSISFTCWSMLVELQSSTKHFSLTKKIVLKKKSETDGLYSQVYIRNGLWRDVKTRPESYHSTSLHESSSFLFVYKTAKE